MLRVTTEQLNAVAELLGTTDKNVVFSAVIKMLVDNGVDVEAAVEAVFGEDFFKRMAGHVYDELRARAAA